MEGTLTSGKKWASGTATVTVDSVLQSGIEVTGLAFKPNIVIVTIGSSASSYCARYAVSIRAGHSLLSNTSVFTSGKDYVMYALPDDWYSSSVATGTMGNYTFHQMGTNSFRIPVSYDSGYGSNMKYNWYATE